jgi:hypothetical protein
MKTTLNNILQAMSNAEQLSPGPAPLLRLLHLNRLQPSARLAEILEFTILLIDDSIFDFDPNEPAESHTLARCGKVEAYNNESFHVRITSHSESSVNPFTPHTRT